MFVIMSSTKNVGRCNSKDVISHTMVVAKGTLVTFMGTAWCGESSDPWIPDTAVTLCPGDAIKDVPALRVAAHWGYDLTRQWEEQVKQEIWRRHHPQNGNPR